MSGEEGFEEWDADFLDQLIQVEELALSSTAAPCYASSSQYPHTHSPPHLEFSHSRYENTDTITHSPPPHLSQRLITDAQHGDARDLQVNRLKGELQRVSKQLTYLEQECLELRKERDEKEEKLKNVYSQMEAKGAEVHYLKSRNLENGVSQPCQNVNTSVNEADFRVDTAMPTCKAKGVQTDMADSTRLTVDNDLSAHDHLSNKLLTIWGSQSGQISGKNLVSKLLVACETDFHVLFGCLSMNMASKMINSLADEDSSDLPLKGHIMSTPSEVVKVSHLYSVLTKVSNGIVRLEALFEALLDLCGVGNAIIVHRSLCILHAVLNHLSGLERKAERRDNVIVEDLCFRDSIMDSHGPESAKSGGLVSVNKDETFYPVYNPLGTRLFDTEVLRKKERWEHGTAMLVSCVNWVSLFELMHQIAVGSTEECVILEAVSIMNVILMRSNAYLEREKFGTLVLKSVSQLLRKEAGLCVQKQAMHLLYLLLNCPNLLVIFCSGCKEEMKGAEDENNDAKNASAFREFSVILDGLANCVACCGNGTQELKLRRNAIIVLAFLASGKSGFEILLGHKLSKQTNFLVLILQLLVSEMDVEVGKSTEPPEIFKERTLLIREALIFLNRLVSNPSYSTAVLRVLTSSRDVASLTIDIANRLSRVGQGHWQSDNAARQMRESEIVDLARVFRKRVFSYLGDKLS